MADALKETQALGQRAVEPILWALCRPLGPAGIREPGRLSGVPAFPQCQELWLQPGVSCRGDSTHLVGLSLARAAELGKVLAERGQKPFSSHGPASLRSICPTPKAGQGAHRFIREGPAGIPSRSFSLPVLQPPLPGLGVSCQCPDLALSPRQGLVPRCVLAGHVSLPLARTEFQRPCFFLGLLQTGDLYPPILPVLWSLVSLPQLLLQ